VCPAAGCQEAIFIARDKRVTGGDMIKWIVWIPWIATIAIVAARAGGYRRVDFFYLTKYGISISDLQSFIAYNIVLFLLIVLPAFIFGRRSFCHHLCWMAPFMILGRKIRNFFQWGSLQLQSNADSCKHCHACTQVCPMSLPVEDMVLQRNMENSECILCGSCVDGCQQHAIAFSWGTTEERIRKGGAFKREESPNCRL
jgi:polyferredoxin